MGESVAVKGNELQSAGEGKFYWQSPKGGAGRGVQGDVSWATAVAGGGG